MDKNLIRTFRRAPMRTMVFNGGNIKEATKKFSLTLNGQRRFYEVRVKYELSFPKYETIGFTREDIKITTLVLEAKTKSWMEGYYLLPERVAEFIQDLDLSSLHEWAKLTDQDLRNATNNRREAIGDFYGSFYGHPSL